MMIPEETKEHQLIDSAKSGDRRAFTQLFKKYEDMVYSFSYKVCRNKEKAEETLQETFIKVFEKLDTFKGESKFSTWLYAIVTNSCLMKHRKTKIDKLVVSIDELPTPSENNINVIAFHPTPAELLIDKELRETMDKAILSLPEEYRIVFVLRDIEGLSIQETSKILKLSTPAVKSRLRRARIFLRDKLNNYLKHYDEM